MRSEKFYQHKKIKDNLLQNKLKYKKNKLSNVIILKNQSKEAIHELTRKSQRIQKFLPGLLL